MVYVSHIIKKLFSKENIFKIIKNKKIQIKLELIKVNN